MSDQLATSGRQLSSRFKVWLCDIWGVVHNGEVAHPTAYQALQQHRKNGGVVILITNAPRPWTSIAERLAELNVPTDSWDAIVSSGDVTAELIKPYTGRNVFFQGPERDEALKQSLSVNWSNMKDAEIVLCSGLDNEDEEDPYDGPSKYQSMLREMASYDLTMICANPDLVVQKGDKLVPCAGALAKIYEEFGGKVIRAGKPFPAIYDVALSRASDVLGRKVKTGEAMAIGDGLKTDIKGAADYNMAVTFVTGGIHEEEYGKESSVEDRANIARNAVAGVNVVGVMRMLEW